MNSKTPIRNATIQLEEYSWKYVAGFYNGVALLGSTEQDKTAADLARLWDLFGADFVDVFNTGAYNSFKHGFRIKLGGMKVSFAPQSEPGTPPPPEQYVVLGESEFGSSFYLPDKIADAPNQKPDAHFRLKEGFVNCYPHYTAGALRLLSLSIHNVVSCLKRFALGEKIPGRVPPEGNWYEDLCAKRAGLTNSIMDTNISENEIKRFSNEELQKHLDSRKGQMKITF